MENKVSIKEKMSFETALSYAGVDVADVIECDKGDDMYHFTYKEHIAMDNVGIDDIKNKELKVEETCIYTFPLGIGVVTDIIYGKPNERALGDFLCTDVIKETKTYTINFPNVENLEYKEEVLYNGVLLDENTKTYSVPENFSLSDGAFVLKDSSIKKR